MSGDHEPDYDSSCSSTLTLPEYSTRSWLSDFSSAAGSRRSSVSVSVCSGDTSSSSLSSYSYKPHKANQAAWEAMRRLRRERGGRIGLDNFRLLRRIGGGDLGNVYAVQQVRETAAGGAALPRCIYAMKVVDREALGARKKTGRAETEREILGMLDHPFLPTLYADFDASNYSCLVTEFCPGGDLHAARLRQPAKRFSISSAKFYVAETLLALEYLHMMGVVYRDLKPENVLIREDGHIMLSDFDLSLKCDVVPKLLRSQSQKPTKSPKNSCTSSSPVISCFLPSAAAKKKNTAEIIIPASEPCELVAEPTGAGSRSFVGTHEYLAPEVITGSGHSAAVDWWALGVFLYEMVYGTTPFKGSDNRATLNNILKQAVQFPRIGVSSKRELDEVARLQDLIERLLVKSPRRRLGSVVGSVEIKRHDFFKGVKWALIRTVKPPTVPSTVRHSHDRRRIRREGDGGSKVRSAAHQNPGYFDCF